MSVEFPWEKKVSQKHYPEKSRGAYRICGHSALSGYCSWNSCSWKIKYCSGESLIAESNMLTFLDELQLHTILHTQTSQKTQIKENTWKNCSVSQLVKKPFEQENDQRLVKENVIQCYHSIIGCSWATPNLGSYVVCHMWPYQRLEASDNWNVNFSLFYYSTSSNCSPKISCFSEEATKTKCRGPGSVRVSI